MTKTQLLHLTYRDKYEYLARVHRGVQRIDPSLVIMFYKKKKPTIYYKKKMSQYIVKHQFYLSHSNPGFISSNQSKKFSRKNSLELLH